MPIEFECPHCSSVLRAPESRAGSNIACPCCGDRLWIPFADGRITNRRTDDTPLAEGDSSKASVPEETDSDPEIPVRVDGVLCRRCRAENDLDNLACWKCAAAISTEHVNGKDVASIINMSWRLFTVNLGLCVMATLVDLATTAMAAIVVLIPAAICAVMLQRVAVAAAIAGSFLILFLGVVVTLSATTVGHYRFFLSLVQGKPISFADMVRFDRHVVRMAVSSAIFWAAVIGGLLAGIVPGLLAMVLLWPYGRLIVDRDLSVSAAFGEALRLTSENLWASFFLFIIWLAVLFGSNSLPVLGLIFSIPFVGILYTVAYQSFLGGPIPAVSQEFSELWGRKKLA